MGSCTIFLFLYTMGATQSLVRENTSNSKKGNSLFFSINLYALQERHSQNGVAEAVATKKKIYQIGGWRLLKIERYVIR